MQSKRIMVFRIWVRYIEEGNKNCSCSKKGSCGEIEKENRDYRMRNRLTERESKGREKKRIALSAVTFRCYKKLSTRQKSSRSHKYRRPLPGYNGRTFLPSVLSSSWTVILGFEDTACYQCSCILLSRLSNIHSTPRLASRLTVICGPVENKKGRK